MTVRIRWNESCCNILRHEPGTDGSSWCFVLVKRVTSQAILFHAGIFIWDNLYPALSVKAAGSSYNCWIVPDHTASRSIMYSHSHFVCTSLYSAGSCQSRLLQLTAFIVSIANSEMFSVVAPSTPDWYGSKKHIFLISQCGGCNIERNPNGLTSSGCQWRCWAIAVSRAREALAVRLRPLTAEFRVRSLLLVPGAQLPLVESFGPLNQLFPFPLILEAGYPVLDL